MCKVCKREMDRIRFVAQGGKDGSVAESTYRCVHCWKEVTVSEPRKAA